MRSVCERLSDTGVLTYARPVGVDSTYELKKWNSGQISILRLFCNFINLLHIFLEMFSN